MVVIGCGRRCGRRSGRLGAGERLRPVLWRGAFGSLVGAGRGRAVRRSVDVVEGPEGGVVESVRSFAFGSGVRRWFVCHTFALKSPPRPQGVRFGHFGGLKTLAVGGVNASERRG